MEKNSPCKTSTPATLPKRCIFCTSGSKAERQELIGEVGYLPWSSSGLTDCCLCSRPLLWLAGWPSKEMRFFTGGWLKVWARRRNCPPVSGSSSGKAGGEPGGEWPGDSSSCWRGQKVTGRKRSAHTWKLFHSNLHLWYFTSTFLLVWADIPMYLTVKLNTFKMVNGNKLNSKHIIQ